ncbi:uncharacterized protein Z518_00362 [Rhinocladiella mackenziei CBS 650.93]|uniref:Signal transduction protein Syg1 n=1 Tax=Rhinocladiella mackenziei CBS 650.93 TaxID=1442369 RepID=A0A0D2HF09_9EURO|nr:uncharacterized protein Z518_00362 [Rhinocladiella mackenziei CBS 650.93]KIX09283.1 hypothetical protein Z518_00362 [Rhinocladiella mackenziei CBS 650.93]
MKFAKELEDEAVPEWRVKYLNYKAGKKKIKAISKALRALNKTPAIPGRPNLLPEDADGTPFTHYDFNRPRPGTAHSIQSLPELDEIAPDQDADRDHQPPAMRKESETWFAQSPPILIPGAESQEGSGGSTPERQPLHGSHRYPRTRRPMNYGSIVGTPPSEEISGHLATLELPDPALNPARGRTTTETEPPPSCPPLPRPVPEAVQVPPGPDPYHVGETTRRARHSLGGGLAKTMFQKRAAAGSQSLSVPKLNTYPRSRLRRLFSAQALDEPTVNDVQLEAYRELDARQAEFFSFLDSELDKIESFYKFKEEEATERLQVLRRQLHEMRDRRLAEILRSKKPEETLSPPAVDGVLSGDRSRASLKEHIRPNGNGSSYFIKKPLEDALARRKTVDKTLQAMQQLSSPPGPKAQQRIHDAKQDYVRHNHGNDIPHRVAKRKLKLALQEFYRALELLKSYALLNRTGFRKINKKYDKAVQARPPLRYMSEKVNNAYFVTSDVIDQHLTAVEDLYSRYFERGNRKIAVRKLRSKLGAGDQSGTTFRNGLYVAAGTCFGVAGLMDASHRLNDPNPLVATHTSYLLQLYAGYFLALLLFLLFCLDCRVWTHAHINYVFVFEYDTRHVLDWRQLAELPCFFLFLNGLFLYLNFQQSSDDGFYLYWPIVLIAITLVMMVLPFKILYYNARRWWGYSNWRLLLAGLYPVEFRDFYLGDMYCSQTYAMGQIEVFFCLYVNDWNHPAQCNSNHSRLLGFFTALPAVWRALQCLRRYHDSRNWFPHLANFCKYLGNILYYMTLSIYRMDMTYETRAAFITFAALNGIYCSFWDVFMDFSLGNPWAKHPFLRDQLAYKKVWVYYFAMVANVVLRQQWVFYAIFTSDLQHSAMLSFLVSLAEVIRRGMWSLFRVENEHCNNVGQFRASRDIPLPYDLPHSPSVRGQSAESKRQTLSAPGDHATQTDATGVDLERSSTLTTTSSLRKRKTPTTPRTPGLRALQRVGTAIASAHAQDFEKRRRPEIEGAGHDDATLAEEGSSDEEDDGDGGDEEVAELQRQRQHEIDEREITEAERMVSRARDGVR